MNGAAPTEIREFLFEVVAHVRLLFRRNNFNCWLNLAQTLDVHYVILLINEARVSRRPRAAGDKIIKS